MATSNFCCVLCFASRVLPLPMCSTGEAHDVVEKVVKVVHVVHEKWNDLNHSLDLEVDMLHEQSCWLMNGASPSRHTS